MSSLNEILGEFREAALSKRDLGDRFERLFAGFLVTEPIFKERFSNVWLWTEWPGRGKKTDTGIGLVAEERCGDGYCAIQCKFFAPGRKVEKADLDSFFATSGKDPRFTSRIVVSTTDHWSKHAEDLLDDPKVQTQRIRLQDLDGSAIDWSQFSLTRPDKMKLRPRLSLRDHQLATLDQILAGLRAADRGRLILACGTGKTFTALRIAERFASGSRLSKDSPHSHGRILLLVPSIALLGQALSEWSAHAEHPMVAFAVCSGTAVGKKVRKGEDTAEIRLHGLSFPATTDAKTLAKLGDDKTTLVYNSKIGLTGISPEAFEYVVNSKSALEQVLERYQVTTDKDSGIINDPNDWASEHGDPEYIFNLVRRVVRVGVESVRIVKALPALEELPEPLG